MTGRGNRIRVRADETTTFLVVFLATLLWNVIAWPATVAAFRADEFVEAIGGQPLLLMVPGFPIVGLLGLYGSWRLFLRARRWGNATAEFTPTTPRAGEPFLTEVVWRIAAPDLLVLIVAPAPGVIGSDYTGTTLRKTDG